MSAPKGLFSPSVISPDVVSSLPAGYTIRPLEREDYHKGFFECIQVLTSTGDVSESRFLERYDYMKNLGVHYFLVIEHEGKIVGTGTLMVERKLYVPRPHPQTKFNQYVDDDPAAFTTWEA
jgi:glucosamine-phosphate N-acetyltransferase